MPLHPQGVGTPCPRLNPTCSSTSRDRRELCGACVFEVTPFPRPSDHAPALDLPRPQPSTVAKKMKFACSPMGASGLATVVTPGFRGCRTPFSLARFFHRSRVASTFTAYPGRQKGRREQEARLRRPHAGPPHGEAHDARAATATGAPAAQAARRKSCADAGPSRRRRPTPSPRRSKPPDPKVVDLGSRSNMPRLTRATALA